MKIKQFCLRNHDTFLTGRTKSGNCRECNKLIPTDTNYLRKYYIANKESWTKRQSIDKGTLRSYTGMLTRCYCVSHDGYFRYGGAGITVCDEWKGKNGYANFLKDMGPRPTKRHSIDRIDNSKGYYPENCRWATPKQQANNKSNSKKLVL